MSRAVIRKLHFIHLVVIEATRRPSRDGLAPSM
jgi:hypothetical protein